MESRSLDACSIVVDTRHLDSPPAFRSQDQRKYAVLRLYPHLRFVSRVRDSPNPQAATTPIKPSPYRLADSAPLPERLRCRQGHPQPCAHAVFHGVGVLENPACRNIPCLQNSYGDPSGLIASSRDRQNTDKSHDPQTSQNLPHHSIPLLLSSSLFIQKSTRDRNLITVLNISSKTFLGLTKAPRRLAGEEAPFFHLRTDRA